MKQTTSRQDEFRQNDEAYLRFVVDVLRERLDFDAVAFMEKIYAYRKLLLETNKVTQLVSRKDAPVFFKRHVSECLAVGLNIDFNRSFLTVDLGSGAGLPGIPLALLFPDSRFLLVDSKAKRVKFLEQVVAQLQLANIEVAWERIENLSIPKKNVGLKVMARAVASLSKLWDWCKNFDLENRGELYAMKGGSLADEINDLHQMYPGLKCQKLHYDSRLVDKKKERVLMKINSQTRV